MSHVRRQIREAAATALLGLTSTGARVFQSRVYPLREADLPGLLVNTDDEQIEADTVVDDGACLRTLTLVVRGVAMATANLDDALDGIAEQVEPVMGGTTLGGLVKSCQLSGIHVGLDDLLQKPVGEIALEYRVTYFTTPSAPGTAL